MDANQIHDEITITIDESGDLKMLEMAMAEPFKILGTTVTKRASYVEPGGRYERWLFKIIRAVVPDDSRLAEWTRTWACLWRVNTKPVGGPILRVRDVCPHINFDVYPEYGGQIAFWTDRQEAIDAEIKFLNTFFLERRSYEQI